MKIFFTLLLASLAYAQTERGQISGVISDASGAAVAAAQIRIVNKATNTPLAVGSGATGDYTAANLPPGNYRIEVTAPGFKKFLQDNITLNASATVRIDATLQLGQVSETIEVTSAVAQVQTENARVSTAVSNKMVDELPLVVGGEMRNPFGLVAIAPEAKGSGTRLSLGGGQARAWNATLDGLSIATNRAADATEIAYTAPSLDAITEFTVDTNGFKAEYGQAGGGVMTFVSKSGTNDFHGNAFEFLRNDAMDARGFFAPRRAVYKQHDFGGTFGGPVIIPKLYNGRNKTFFFASYEGFRNRVGSTDAFFSVPAPEMFNGDFSNLVDASNRRLLIYDPSTTTQTGTTFSRQPFPNNQIPPSRFSTFARQVLPFASPVKPNVAGITPGNINYIRNNYISQGGSLTTPTNKGSIKVDQNLGSKQRIGYFMNITRFENTLSNSTPGLPEPLWSGQVSQFYTEAYRVTHDYTATPNLLNHFAFGINQFYKNSFSSSSGKGWKDKICMKNAVDCNDNFPRLTFSEFSTWGAASYNGTEQPMYSIKNDTTWINGRHTFKFGYAYDDQRANGFGQQDIMGAAGFSFLGTGVPGVTTFTSGSSFASFLLGEANSGNTETIRKVTQFYRYHGFYFQDDFRINRRLILNFGLRYDNTRPPISATDAYSDFTPDRPNPAVNGFPGALRFAGTGQGREGVRSLVPSWNAGWGPRLSIAYSLNDKTTFRAGAGRSFSRVAVVGSSGHFAGFIGQYSFASPNNGVTPAFRVDEGLPAYTLPPRIDPSFQNNQTVDYWNGLDAVRAPENITWTASLQRQLNQNTVLEVAYNASLGSHLPTALLNFNQIPTPLYNGLVDRFGAVQANNILRAQIGTALPNEAGIRAPYANFTNPAVQLNRTAGQALRPFPQYLNIQTGQREGDKSGHSTYHAMVIKVDRRYSNGLTFNWSYALSKLLTDSDSYGVEGSASQDHFNRRLEKSIGRDDQTHALKLNTIYELPFGKGRRFALTNPVVNALAGGWRIGMIQSYVRGFPIGISRNNPLVIFNGTTRPTISSYDGWQPAWKGDGFDPAVDRRLDRAAFPAQPIGFGNATRFNPRLREFPNLNENISLGKTFQLKERFRIDFRAEAFNLFNRTRFGNGSTNLDANNFGVVVDQTNTQRQMQMALKLYW
ncbi:MAG: carboxypeptidase regulatory-like domain-containing protein [Acidobacteriota bacterium]